MTAPSLKVQAQGQSNVSADNLNTFMQTCNIASDLRAFIGVTGIQVFMRGQTAIGDGYQGVFYWNSSGVAADDNGVTTIVPNGASAGEWTRLTPPMGTNYSRQTPTTGFSITIANGMSSLILTPAGTLSTGTIVMPQAPLDGQIVNIMSTQIVTTLTLSPNISQTINGAPTTIAANRGFSMIYSLPNLNWYRMST